MENKKRYSPKREAILNNLKNRCDHPTAAMVFESMRAQYPDISLGTVYRNLNELVAGGSIISFQEKNVERYDGNIEPHLHFCCEGCGEITDIFHSAGLRFSKFPELSECEINGYKVIINGKCKGCKAQ